jgi:hypothetical protein
MFPMTRAYPGAPQLYTDGSAYSHVPAGSLFVPTIPKIPTLQELARAGRRLDGYSQFEPGCSAYWDNISREESISGRWSFYICRSGTYNQCYLSRTIYVGLQAATAAAEQLAGKQFYATTPKPLHLLQQVGVQDTIQAPDGAPPPPLTVY